MGVEIFLRRILFGLIAANFVTLVWWMLATASTSVNTKALDLDAKSVSLHAEVPDTQSVSSSRSVPDGGLEALGLARTASNELISEHAPSTGGRRIFGSSDSDMEKVLLKLGPGDANDDTGSRISHENCRIFAPFVSYADAEALAKLIESQGGRVHIEEQVISRKPDYLVYIEPAASREVAQRTLKELKGQSIDSQIIAEGALMNGLSVGVFSKIAPAEAQKQRVADLGYEVNLVTLGQPRTVYRLISNEVLVGGPDATNSVRCDAVAYVPSIL